jgi:hypothetical protein
MSVKQVVTVNEVELINILSNVNTPQFVSGIFDVKVEMKKFLDYWLINDEGKKKKNPNPTPNPYYENGIRKVSKKYKLITGFDYEKSVNRRLEKEGKESDFETKENWFDVISKGLVVNKNNPHKFYFRYQYQPDSTTQTTSFFQGNEIEKSLYESYVNQTNDYENQGLDNPLRFQVVGIENVKEITLGGTHYYLVR